MIFLKDNWGTRKFINIIKFCRSELGPWSLITIHIQTNAIVHWYQVTSVDEEAFEYFNNMVDRYYKTGMFKI